MSLFVRKYYKFILPVIIILVGFGIFWQQVGVKADTCNGYMYVEGEYVSVTYDCTFQCDDFYNTNGYCPQPGVKSECVGDDSFGSGPYNDTDFVYPDGTGDVRHLCSDSIPGGSNCDNFFQDYDPDVEDNMDPEIVSSMCVSSSCDVSNGSYVLRRAWCEQSGNTASQHTTSDTGCFNDVDNIMDLYGLAYQFRYQLPGIDLSSPYDREGGFCLDYCEVDSNGNAVDWGTCTAGDLADSWDSYEICPRSDYDAYCSGDTLNKYTCDGQPTVPFDLPYPGRDIGGTTQTDCTLENFPATCDNSCGYTSGSETDVCQAETFGICDSTSYESAMCDASDSNLDNVGSSGVDQFNATCAPWSGDVQWVQGAVPAVHGEYDNEVRISINGDGGPNEGWNTTRIREFFETEACGDDQGEYNKDGYCCDDPNDEIVEDIPDYIEGDVYVLSDYSTHDIDMSGDYCVSPTGCGNFVIDPGEECDSIRGQLWHYGPGDPNYLFIGDDAACVAAGGSCQSDCTCSEPLFNEDGDLFIITNGDVTNDNNILLKMDDSGIFLLRGTVIKDIFPGWNLDDIDVSTEKYVVTRDSGPVIMYIDDLGNMHLPVGGGVELQDPNNVDIANREMVWQDDGVLLGVLDSWGNLYVKNYIVENAL